MISGLGIGGAELVLKRLVFGAVPMGQFKHVVVSLTTIGPIGDQLRLAGVEVHCLNMASGFDTPRAFFDLFKLVRSQRPDIIQTWMYHADLMGGLVGRLAGHSNVLWGIRSTEVQSSSKLTATIRRLCALLSNWIPNTIVCAAEASKKSHLKIGYAAARMVVIPNGFDAAHMQASEGRREEMRFRFGLKPTDLVIGTVGRFHPAKDHNNFVEAAGLLWRRFPSARFLMIGRDLDPDNLLLKRWVEDTGCPDRFVLVGERSDVPACLAAMDVFALSSKSEGFPNVLGEAMAMGLACVTTDVGDAAMLLGDAGRVVPPQNSARLAEALLQIVRLSRAEREELGELASKRVRSEFSMERTRNCFETLYEDVIRNKKGWH